jgi:hypothetical protein
VRAIFQKAKVILEGAEAFLCLGIPYREAKKFTGEMKDRKYVLEIHEYRQRRSLDANAYCWLLLGKLSAKLGIPADQLYREAIQDVGDNFYIMPIRDDAVERWVAIWQHNGIGWICENLGPSKIEGYTNVLNYYGSSVYDKAQMARLIDIIVEECREQDIETLTPEELAKLMEVIP